MLLLPEEAGSLRNFVNFGKKTTELNDFRIGQHLRWGTKEMRAEVLSVIYSKMTT
jgi:hypothetical protein